MLTVKLKSSVYEVEERQLMKAIISNYGYVDQYLDEPYMDTIKGKRYLIYQPAVDCIYYGDTVTQNSQTFISVALQVNNDGTINPKPVEITYDYTDAYKNGQVDADDACDWDKVKEIKEIEDARVDWFSSDIEEIGRRIQRI